MRCAGSGSGAMPFVPESDPDSGRLCFSVDVLLDRDEIAAQFLTSQSMGS